MMLSKTNGSYSLNPDALTSLVEARKRLGKTPEQVASRVGIGTIHFGRLERGYSVPTWKLLAAWAKCVGCEVEIVVKEKKL